MLSLEMIGVMGALFVFLVFAMVRTQVARREAEAQRRAEDHTTRPAQEAR
jgi:hypothetical protein